MSGAAPLLLFDFDGVVADSLPVFHRAVTESCAALGHPVLADRESFLALFDGNMYEGLAALGLSDETIAAAVRGLPGRIAEAADRIPLFAGAREMLVGLAARHPLYVITSNATAVVAGQLARAGIVGVRAVLGADAGTSKIRKIRAVAAEYPERAPVYVGDTLGDLREGRAAGARTVAVTWGWHPEAHLLAGAPDHLVRSPAELLALFA